CGKSSKPKAPVTPRVIMGLPPCSESSPVVEPCGEVSSIPSDRSVSREPLANVVGPGDAAILAAHLIAPNLLDLGRLGHQEQLVEDLEVEFGEAAEVYSHSQV